MAVPYHIHTFNVPTATEAEVIAGVATGKVIEPANLGSLAPLAGATLGETGLDVLADSTPADARTTLELGSAAVEDVTAFATAASGALADTAVQPGDLAAVATSGSADDIVNGAANKVYTAAEQTKLAGVEAGATANATNAALRDRSTHTGTQTADTVTDGTTNKAYTAGEQTKLGALPDNATLQTSLGGKISATEKGAASGVATLDGGGKVPAGQLPSYVDDVLEYANQAAFPASGEGGKIYIAINGAIPSNPSKQYRWSGTTYTEISPSPGSTDAVPEGSGNLYYTATRVRDAVLTGLSTASSAVISAADSVLSAIGKLQAQVTAFGALASSAVQPVGAQNIAVTSDYPSVSLKALPATFPLLRLSGPDGRGYQISSNDGGLQIDCQDDDGATFIARPLEFTSAGASKFNARPFFGDDGLATQSEVAAKFDKAGGTITGSGNTFLYLIGETDTSQANLSFGQVGVRFYEWQGYQGRLILNRFDKTTGSFQGQPMEFTAAGVPQFNSRPYYGGISDDTRLITYGEANALVGGGGGGGGTITSVFGRSGPLIDAQSGDYNSSQITHGGGSVSTALSALEFDTLDGGTV